MFGMCLGAAVLYIASSLEDVTSVLQYCIPPMLASLPMNSVQNIITRLARYDYLPVDYNSEDPYMIQSIQGITFNNPIALSPGIDVNCDGPHSLIKLGFGAVEIGTITIEPQQQQKGAYELQLSGADEDDDKSVEGVVSSRIMINQENEGGSHNILRRWLRILYNLSTDYKSCMDNKGNDDDDAAVRVKRDMNTFTIHYPSEDDVRNRWLMLQSVGVHEISKRLDNIDFTPDLVRIGRVGVSMKASTTREVRIGIEALADRVHWISLDCRHIENDIPRILHLYQAALARRKDFDDRYRKEVHDCNGDEVQLMQLHQPARLFIRVSVNQNDDAREELARKIAEDDKNIEGIVINGAVYNKDKNETISGRETRPFINECVGKWYKELKGKVPIIASGGVMRGHDALDLIEHGASVIQVYSAFIFQGPQAARRLKDQLSDLLLKRGYYNIEEAIGAKLKKKNSRRVKEFHRKRIPFIT
ncbi:hypothetical protein FOZ61_006174 [Perkinsus olseni]|nr:hypothetical protein FOZ61_006174 [Perkinsus olseni]